MNVVPEDSRYVPLTQQRSCCAPTCIQMIMYKNGIPLKPAEEIGYHMGLTVSLDAECLFYNARTSATPPHLPDTVLKLEPKDSLLMRLFLNLSYH